MPQVTWLFEHLENRLSEIRSNKFVTVQKLLKEILTPLSMIQKVGLEEKLEILETYDLLKNTK